VNAGGGQGVRGEINVTPLVDVVLVLLIIFMVVTPMLRRGKEVTLPPARTSDPPGSAADPLVVSVTADGALWLEEAPCDEARLAEALRADPARPVLLRGDARVTVGEVRRVMSTLQRAGARGVRVAVEGRGGDGGEG
jgi:biopolymer transport protein ExbD